MRLPVAATLLLLGLTAVPNAAAGIDLAAPGAPLLEATAAEVALLPCRTVGGDWDRDGETESWNVCSTPTCGCACPVVGVGVVLEVPEQEALRLAGQERGAWVATSGCQTAYGTMVDDADGDGPHVTPFVWTWGLPPIATA